MYLKPFISLVILILFSNIFSFSQENSDFLYSETIRKTKSEIAYLESIIKKRFANTSIDTNNLLFVPVYLTHLQFSKANQTHDARTQNDTLPYLIGEILILRKDNFSLIGSFSYCKNDGMSVYFIKSKYVYLSTMPCRFDDRLLKETPSNFKGIKALLRRTRGQLLFIKINKVDGLFYLKKNSNELLKL